MVDQDSRIQELTEALEKLTGRDREMDAKICVAVFHETYVIAPTALRAGCVGVRCDVDNGLGYISQCDAPAYTASIDAALTLLPRGLPWSLGTRDRKSWGIKDGQPDIYWADITSSLPVEHKDYVGIDAAGTTPAIALCIACLRARAALEGTK